MEIISYPRYYDGTTSLQGNGVGVLRDAVRCTVTEERNGAFELEMVYPITGQHYSSLALRGLILAKPNPYGEAQYFRIYKISRPINGQVTVNAQHISYDLSGIPVGPCTALNAVDALQQLKSHAEVSCDYTFWTDIQTVADFSVAVPSSMRSLLGGVEGSVLDVYGGEYEWDNTTVKLHSQRGTDRGVTIRYGKNLTDLTQEESCAEVYTGVYPYWVDSDGNVTQITGSPVVNVPGGQYDFVRVLTLDVSQDIKEQPTAAQLRQAALDYISANKVGVPKVSLTLSFAQLEQTAEYADMALLERVLLCDTVHVQFAKLGVSADARCIKTVYDVLLERYDSVELGDARSSLANTVADMGKTVQSTVNKTRSDLERAIDRATQLITGNLGGNVIMHKSANSDYPDEILIMDTADIKTAKKVWRWNASGLGYSSTGYNGPYGLAITANGEIVADFITSGTIDANEVKIVNLIADHFRSVNGNFIMTAWAAVLSISNKNMPRVHIYSSTGDVGMVALWGGNTDEKGNLLDDNAQVSHFSAGGISLGQTKNNKFKGNILCGNINCATVSCDDGVYVNNTYMLKNENGKKLLYADRMSIEGGAAQDVHWTWSSTLGGYVLSTSSSLK